MLKRLLDIIASLCALLILAPLLLALAVLVRIKLGSPVLFKQARPGLNAQPFYMLKFRSMSDEKDQAGNLLPDEQRLTKFGLFLRASSMDELPGLWNVFIGKADAFKWPEGQ